VAGANLQRSYALISFCLVIGLLGWVIAIASGPVLTIGVLLLFVVLAVLTELAGFRIPPADPHSLTGMVLLGATLALGPPNGALIAAVAGLIFGVAYPLLVSGPRSFYILGARPIFRSGLRAIAILAGGALAAALGFAPSNPWSLLVIIPVYMLIIQVGRAAREYLQGGSSGLSTWWISSWQPMLLGEVMPLPGAALLAAVYSGLGAGYFVMAGVALIAASIAVRQAMQNLRLQRRSVRELALLNEASRAIIRAELDVDALCELIYRQASRVVDTSSFHLGLFDPGSDRYTLVVRVQDRVRLPRLTVELPAGDGIVGWIRQTGRALLVEDFTREMDRLPARPRYQSERPPRSGIYVPLINGETVIGSLSIQSYRPNMFGTDDMRMLSLIADQAAVAISKARAYEDARHRAVQLQAIQAVSERITAILDLDELLTSVVNLIREHFGYHPVHIFTLEPDNNLVFRASTAGLSSHLNKILPIGQGLVGSVARLGQPVLANDVRSDPRYINDDVQTRSEFAVPLRFGDEIIGVLDLQSTTIERFQERDQAVLQTLADQIAVAIESARAFMTQREEAWTLNALLQVTENITRVSSFDELLRASVRLPPLFLGCERCYCLLWARDQGTLTPRAAYGLSEAQRQAFVGWPFGVENAPLLEEAIRTITPIALEDVGADRAQCPPVLEPFGGRALLVLPLWSRGSVLGLLVADYDTPRERFTQREMTIYNSIASQMAGVLENMLLAEEAAAAGRLEEELRVARGVQTALLPEHVPDLPGWEAAAAWHSARIVGGDFYDYWWLTINPEVLGETDHEHATRWLGFVIADVSDKGVPAAMFMALSRSLVRAAALDGSSPSQALVRANRWITRDSESAMFVTIFYGLVDPKSGRMAYCCAGHNPPVLCRANDDIVELSTPGIALGVLDEISLGQDEVTFESGDMLVCYTDGVTEAFDDQGEAFGTARLQALIREHRSKSANELLEIITSTLFQFSGGPLADDVTLVIVKRQQVPAALAAAPANDQPAMVP
jgi:serine phosphatase RsbU (regulator of sigma subunit)/putative methionine-R-sulfoxide reductase with GAF domain